jgi:uncharacterized protein
MNTINSNENIKPWHKEFYVWMIIFFPVLAIVGGIVTTFLAVKSNDGLVVDDYYKQGLEINRTLERDQVAFDYNLDAIISLNQELEEVVIQFSSNSNFVYPQNLSVTFLHSTRAGLDKEVSMILTQDHIYRGNLAALEAGKWYVHIQRDNWRLIKTILITK